MSDQQWLVLRTKEIIDGAAGEIAGKDAVKTALRERFNGNYDQLIDFAAGLTSVLKKIKNATYELPDEPTLFDIPQTIVVNTEIGPVFISGEERQLGHVRSWASDGLQHHASQKYRFGQVIKELKKLESHSDEIGWDEARLVLACKEAAGDDEAQ